MESSCFKDEPYTQRQMLGKNITAQIASSKSERNLGGEKEEEKEVEKNKTPLFFGVSELLRKIDRYVAFFRKCYPTLNQAHQ